MGIRYRQTSFHARPFGFWTVAYSNAYTKEHKNSCMEPLDPSKYFLPTAVAIAYAISNCVFGAGVPAVTPAECTYGGGGYAGKEKQSICIIAN